MKNENDFNDVVQVAESEQSKFSVKKDVKPIGVSKKLTLCKSCKRKTYTNVFLVDGKKKCTCMHCNEKKPEPTGQLTRC